MREKPALGVVVSRALSAYAVAVFALMWVGFAVALLVDPEWLDVLWEWVRSLPTLAEVVVWVLFLPITVALWIWESSWALVVRLLAWAGMVGWTLLAASGFRQARREPRRS